MFNQTFCQDRSTLIFSSFFNKKNNNVQHENAEWFLKTMVWCLLRVTSRHHSIFFQIFIFTFHRFKSRKQNFLPWSPSDCFSYGGSIYLLTSGSPDDNKHSFLKSASEVDFNWNSFTYTSIWCYFLQPFCSVNNKRTLNYNLLTQS